MKRYEYLINIDKSRLFLILKSNKIVSTSVATYEYRYGKWMKDWFCSGVEYPQEFKDENDAKLWIIQQNLS